jgi:CRISPR/Cas system CSM-associated protein Csm2 small subunit
MKEGIDINEVIGFFESIEEDDLKIADLSSQIKAIKLDIGSHFKEVAKDFETKAKQLKQAYKYWVERKREIEQGEDITENDFSILMNLIDLKLEEES